MKRCTANHQKPLTKWTNDDVKQWLIEGGWEKYTKCLDVNGAALAGFSEEDLIDIVAPVAETSALAVGKAILHKIMTLQGNTHPTLYFQEQHLKSVKK